MRIFVMARGWNLYGEIDTTIEKNDEMFHTLKRCGIIRRWGTDEGLGQLASEGPRAETILDPEPDGTEINVLEIHRSIPCNGKKWKGVKSMIVEE